jgi:hypothetical protein
MCRLAIRCAGWITALAAIWCVLVPRAASGQAPWAIYVMNTDGTDVKKISHDDDRYFGSPVFSHDGKRGRPLGLRPCRVASPGKLKLARSGRAGYFTDNAASLHRSM